MRENTNGVSLINWLSCECLELALDIRELDGWVLHKVSLVRVVDTLGLSLFVRLRPR